MARIFRLDNSTLYLCDNCFNDLGPLPVPGTWREEPLAECSVCGEVDLRTREELDAYHHDMSNQQWEEEQQEPDFNPQELK